MRWCLILPAMWVVLMVTDHEHYHTHEGAAKFVRRDVANTSSEGVFR